LISRLIIRKWRRYFSYKTTGFNVRNGGDLKLQEYPFEIPELYYTNYLVSQTSGSRFNKSQ
jgi:hypothetical protein